MTRVLIVDGDGEAAELLATLLRLSTPSVGTACAHTAHSALMLAAELQPNVALIDLDSRLMSGKAIAGGVLAACSARRPVLIGLCEQDATVTEVCHQGIFDHALTKPLDLPSLVRLITRSPTQATT
jgi:DNA-binding NtrC family response regulator